MILFALILSTTSPSSIKSSNSINGGTFYTTLAFTVDDYRSRRASLTRQSSLCMSSVSGGSSKDNYPDDNNDDDDNSLNEWMQRKDTENIRAYREQLTEGRLSISYGAMNTNDNDSDDNMRSEKKNGGQQFGFGPLSNNTNTQNDVIDTTATSPSSLSTYKTNPYLSVVSRLTPSDLISRFTASASPRVQDAVRTTVLNLIGGLPQMAFETKTVATGERLASLMFQLQMTGYMFKNAEYRLSLSQSLGGSDRMLPGGVDEGTTATTAVKEGKGRLKGKIKVRYGGGGKDNTSENNDNEDESKSDESDISIPGMEVEVDAQSYLSELRGEVNRLRDELDNAKQTRSEEIRKDLLMYIRTLPPQELQQLTGTMSPEVLEAMKGLVTAVLAGITEDDEDLDAILGGGGSDGQDSKIGPNTVTEQSGEALAQLCMWQLVVGFNLRELEVRDSMKKNLLLGDIGKDEGNEFPFGPGALE